MESACRLSTNVIRLSKSISKHSLRSFLHCAECVFLAPSDSAKFIAFLCKKNRRATKRYEYNALLAANPPDSSKINAVAKEMENLRQSLDELRVKRDIAMAEAGIPRGAGMGMGYGGCGGGGHMGMGHW